MSEAAILTPEIAPAPTPLAIYLQTLSLQTGLPRLSLRLHAGVLTPEIFSSREQELTAAIRAKAIFDLGYRTRIRVTGEDRLRWLNGMASNAIQSLAQSPGGGHGNYNFILNAQGRIQGDAYIYRAADSLLIDTDRSQAGRLLAHLDHFIIMDDVELHPLDDRTTGIAIAGPEAASALSALGLNAQGLAALEFAEGAIGGVPVTLVRAYSVLIPRYELWFSPEDATAIWSALVNAGAEPAGIDSAEALRVLEGIPRYGVDITDRHLPQETAQARALNFTKGCYLGQEIVERIRSRATVHRRMTQVLLEGSAPAAPVDLTVVDPSTGERGVVGQLSSIGQIHLSSHSALPGYSVTVGLGLIRVEALERKSRIEYDGGTATVLEAPPTLPISQ